MLRKTNLYTNINQWLPMAGGSGMGVTANWYGVSSGGIRNILKFDHTTLPVY